MSQTEASAPLRLRAMDLARTGDFAGWTEVRERLIAEGYLETFNPAIHENNAFHAEINGLCERYWNPHAR